ncbi:peptidoglycan editing factor PgeF [Bermanella marisrubri]|uniref:Purine nucleoside phosphorylase n=1 Tax=Bermanella marisrubri TaxID=207949 RepID=Q1N001_9GAMM|nr:peptidoglycan editing factor PgeF [Bermanella marisrubri]EAT11562.1 hypothetical protein RED65_02789 [Oceanobacter sp. RED65] [Bermanella marisrubri]QIZ84975.1 peptidoglycan editing factor PgeF [Bermanella marisrubri]
MYSADWPVPKHIKTLITTRDGGVSSAPYDSLNLGHHVEDDPQAVKENRSRLYQHLPGEPAWLQQVHGTVVVDANTAQSGIEADAVFSDSPAAVCAVMTADCLPVLFTNVQGTKVAAAHAGWKGLMEGVLEATLSKFSGDDVIIAYLGPAIGPNAFEVGPEVRDGFIERNADAESCFRASSNKGKWLGDMYALARIRLLAQGVKRIYGGMECTFTQEDKYFSYRRDGMTGRMASCIWIENQ